MKAGNRIKVDVGWYGMYDDWQEFTVEEFRYCLGIFKDEDCRKAGKFTPLCEIYIPGPESSSEYISNFGEYTSNLVQGWADIPK